MHTFSIAGKTISIFPSIAPGAPIFYLNTYAGEGQQVLDAARAAGCPRRVQYLLPLAGVCIQIEDGGTRSDGGENGDRFTGNGEGVHLGLPAFCFSAVGLAMLHKILESI